VNETAADRISHVTECHVQHILHHSEREPLSPEEFVEITHYPNNGACQKIEDIAFVCLFQGY